MIQDIYMKEPRWHVRVYYTYEETDIEDIIDYLVSIGCRGEKLSAAKENLWRHDVNSGYTFVNNGEGVMIIGAASSGAEFDNSLFHEKMHLMAFIADELDLNPYGERICYIGGELTRVMHKIAKNYMCDCCRKKYRRLR